MYFQTRNLKHGTATKPKISLHIILKKKKKTFKLLSNNRICLKRQISSVLKIFQIILKSNWQNSQAAPYYTFLVHNGNAPTPGLAYI